jgi:hypothetical protein
MTLPRSTNEIMYVSPSDFDLYLNGGKSATSRYGDRTLEYPVGKRLVIKENAGENRREESIMITKSYKIALGAVNEFEAKAIGNYLVADHTIDFYNIYSVNMGKEVNGTTGLTVIFFAKA